MSYTITDNINFIEVDNGSTIFYLKKKFEVDIVSNVIHLENCDCPKDFIDVPYSEIATPTAANITAMRALLQSYNNTNGATSDNQTNGNQKTQIVDAGGEAVTVTGGKLDVNASIDTTGLATETTLTSVEGAVQSIQAQQADGTQKTQIVNSLNEEIGTPAKPIYVNVVNQVDLTILQNLLADIKTFAQNIDANTDGLETKLDTINTAISNGFTVNHSDLLNVISELQGIDANTDGIELQLASLITNTNGLALETTLAAIKTQTDKLTFVLDELKVIASVSIAPQTITAETTTAVTATNVVSTILAANANRKGYTVYNDGTQAAYILHATGATAALFKYKLDKGSFYEMPSDLNYKGVVTAITASSTASLKVTELT